VSDLLFPILEYRSPNTTRYLLPYVVTGKEPRISRVINSRGCEVGKCLRKFVWRFLFRRMLAHDGQFATN
jgi:hypothetical protein